MSFHQGGMRFKSGLPSPRSENPPDPAMLFNEQAHPLRQNGVGNMASQPNSKSYAARAQGRPELSLDTSPSYPPSSTQLSTIDLPQSASQPSVPRRSSRRDPMSDRSPLQKLEGTLGDISREEKRARAEEAEQAARQRAALANGVTYTGSRRRSADTTREYAQQRLPTSTNSMRSNNRRQAGATSYPGLNHSSSTKQATPGGYERPTSKDRNYGRDAALSSGAAAAALGAYQISRSQPQDDDESEGLRHESWENNATSQPKLEQPLSVSKQRTSDRSVYETPKQQSIQSQNQRQISDQPLEPSSARQAFTRGDHEADAPFFTPPQSSGGERAPASEASTSTRPASQSQKGVRFSGTNHPQMEDKPRLYRGARALEEWRSGETAVLSADDQNLEGEQPEAVDQTAWWEQSKTARRASQKRAPSGAAQGESQASDSFKTTFHPELLLKCGPLLRYTGIRGDKQGDSATARSFWRGSVMIVTEDAISSYDPAPTLRLFKQPMEMLPKARGRDAATADDIGCMPTCSPTGQTVFARPVRQLQAATDLSQREDSQGLFTSHLTEAEAAKPFQRLANRDGEKAGRVKEVKAHRLHAERGCTFWRFNIEVELGEKQTRIAYRINRGPAIGFWVPAKDQPMNIMFHSCNGFSASVDSNQFSGPDPLWRDVLNSHQSRPFHVMLGGGDQIYNDACARDTVYFKQWTDLRAWEHKKTAPFSQAMQEELEHFYLNRYATWFSNGLFGMANSQIPMVNIWDDHDIIDGFGSYPHSLMNTPVFSGVGAVAFKYYMLFQHQSLPAETTVDEPSWVLGSTPGPYIHELSRHVFMFLGKDIAFLGLDCRTERMREEVLSDESYHIAFDRLDREIIKGETKHLIVMLGVPIAYPRMTFAENILTSRAMDPVKALARAGMFGGLLNKFDGGVEVLDDLDDHWTAKHHKEERNWLIENLQDFAAERSVRITILGGDVHLAAVGQFYSKKKLNVPKDRDNRYIPNIISSAIVNTPPPDTLADFLNKRNRVHHFDKETDEDMIPLFTHDVDGRERNNQHLLPRRNWCSIRPYTGEITPPPSPRPEDEGEPRRTRSFSLTRRGSGRSRSTTGGKPNLLRRLSNRVAPPSSYKAGEQTPYGTDPADDRRWRSSEDTPAGSTPASSFSRRPSNAAKTDPSGREGHIDLSNGLEVTLNCEINQKDPAGKTMPYRMIIPALSYGDGGQALAAPREKGRMSSFIGSIRRGHKREASDHEVPYDTTTEATPPLKGDQRFTTMVENGKLGPGNVEALRNIQTPGENGKPGYGVADLQHLPRDSGPVETEFPMATSNRFHDPSAEARSSASTDAVRRPASSRSSGQPQPEYAQAFGGANYASHQQSTMQQPGRQQNNMGRSSSARNSAQQPQYDGNVQRSNTVAAPPQEPPKPLPTDIRRGVSRRSYADPFAHLSKNESKPTARGLYDNYPKDDRRSSATSHAQVPDPNAWRGSVSSSSQAQTQTQPQQQSQQKQPATQYEQTSYFQPQPQSQGQQPTRRTSQQQYIPQQPTAHPHFASPPVTDASGSAQRPQANASKPRATYPTTPGAYVPQAPQKPQTRPPPQLLKDKDPYAHLLPEAVDAEYASDAGSQPDHEHGHGHGHGHDGTQDEDEDSDAPFEFSDVSADSPQLPARNPRARQSRAGASASRSRSPSPISPMHPAPAPRRGPSKLERLTGETGPREQSGGGKAAARLGVGEDEMKGPAERRPGRYADPNEKSGRFSGLVRRMSDAGKRVGFS